MCQFRLILTFVLAILAVGIRCQSGEDSESRPESVILSRPEETQEIHWPMPYRPRPIWPMSYRPRPIYDFDYGGSCNTEIQHAMADVKSEVRTLQQLVVGLRQKLDPDFKLPTPPESKCPPGFQYVSLARSCYKVVYEEHNWTSADQKCHDLHPEAHLVAIASSGEDRALTAYLQQDLARNSHLQVCKLHSWGDPCKMLWTSGQRENETSCTTPFVWKLSNDTHLPLSFSQWNLQEPNCHANEEFCIHIRPTTSYKWNDLSCNRLLCPLCEYDPK